MEFGKVDAVEVPLGAVAANGAVVIVLSAHGGEVAAHVLGTDIAVSRPGNNGFFLLLLVFLPHWTGLWRRDS